MKKIIHRFCSSKGIFESVNISFIFTVFLLLPCTILRKWPRCFNEKKTLFLLDFYVMWPLFRLPTIAQKSQQSASKVTCACLLQDRSMFKAFHVLATLWWTRGMLTLTWHREACSGDFFQKMLRPLRKRVRTLDSFFSSTRSPSQADALQNDTKDSSTDGEQIKGKEAADESSESKTTNARSFQTPWLLDHRVMFCHFCRKSKKTKPYGSAGYTNYR